MIRSAARPRLLRKLVEAKWSEAKCGMRSKYDLVKVEMAASRRIADRYAKSMRCRRF